MASDPRHIRAERILVGEHWKTDAIVTLSDQGRILDISSAEQFDGEIEDLGNAWLLPGLIDSHVHGAKGHDVMDASHEALNEISRHCARHGVTGFAATTVTAPVQKIKDALQQIAKSREAGLDGAELLGGYLEGPYFTPTHKGAHPDRLFRELDCDELDSWMSYSDNALISVALAPEKNDAIKAIKHLKSQGVRVMLGHTDASYDDVKAAFDAGADGIVHCYNGMRGLHHRDPGVVGAGLTADSGFVEMIADGHHVHPTAIDVAHRCCGDRLLLITDAMQAAGMPDGHYQLGELTVEMKEGVVRTAQGGLAGSTLILLDGVKNLSRWLDLPFEQAWLRASLTPAKSLGLDHKLGSIAVGKQASMVALSPEGDVLKTWVNGRPVFSTELLSRPEAVCI